MLRKFHEAKLYNHDDVEIWGTGTPLREFLYVDDMADACTFLMENYNGEEHVNIGTGEEITIKELAEVIRKVVGFKGNIRFNASMPDGTPRKLTNINKIKNMGWKAKVNLYDGITVTYQNYIKEFMFGDN